MRRTFVLVGTTLIGASVYGCQFIAGVAGLEATGQSEACESAADCPGKYCTDGFCCDVADCGECHSCGLLGKEGSCQAVNEPCGGTCADGKATPSGICSEGKCSAEPVSCGDYVCNAAGTACNEVCDRGQMPTGCAEGAICTGPSEGGHCDACGWSPPAGSMCNPGCESCSGGVCTTTCDTPGECAAPLMLDVTKGSSARLLCKDQCNDIKVTCAGGSFCEVICEEGGCTNLTLACDINGPCKLTCHGSACGGAKVECGDNQCVTDCDGGAAVNMICKNSCGCTKAGCK